MCYHWIRGSDEKEQGRPQRYSRLHLLKSQLPYLPADEKTTHVRLQTVICPGRVDGNAENVSNLFLFPFSAMKPSKFHGLNRRWVNTHPAHSDVHCHCSQQVIFSPHTATCFWHTLLFERLKYVTFNAYTPVKNIFAPPPPPSP